MKNWYKTYISWMIPTTSDVNNQNNHVEADVNVKKSEMTNGHSKMRNGKKGKYLQNVSVSVVCSDGRDGIWSDKLDDADVVTVVETDASTEDSLATIGSMKLRAMIIILLIMTDYGQDKQ